MNWTRLLGHNQLELQTSHAVYFYILSEIMGMSRFSVAQHLVCWRCRRRNLRLVRQEENFRCWHHEVCSCKFLLAVNAKNSKDSLLFTIPCSVWAYLKEITKSFCTVFTKSGICRVFFSRWFNLFCLIVYRIKRQLFSRVQECSVPVRKLMTRIISHQFPWFMVSFVWVKSLLTSQKAHQAHQAGAYLQFP